MIRILTKEQVEVLYNFCENEEVFAYDLQVEIVDHLATSIEDQWKSNPEITFEDAVENLYSKFGLKEFRELEKQMARQLKRKFNLILWRYFLEFFKLPKIIVSVVLTLFIFVLLQSVNNNTWVIIIYCVPFSIASIYYNFVLFPKKIEIKTAEGKSFLTLNYLENINRSTGSIVQLPLIVMLFSSSLHLQYTNMFFAEILISIILSILTVLMYGYFFFLPKKIKEHFMANFAEFVK